MMDPYPISIVQTEKRIARDKILGAIALFLIFSAAASFSWVYFSDESASARAPEAEAATAILPSSSEPVALPDSFANVRVQARSAIVVDLTSGRTLFAQNADLQWPLASITKAALALVVAEVLPADSVITIPYDTAPAGNYERLRKGEHWKVRDVIDFTLAVSSNSGADILADAANEAVHARYPLSPETTATLWRMNDLAKQLGLSHTYFLNDNGLDVSATQSGGLGSARDVATLFAYAASTTPDIFAATTKPSFKMTSSDGAEVSAINTDEALQAVPGIVMGKTGYTDLAGGNLAVVFDEDGHRIAAVVLGSTESGRFDDMETLVTRTHAAIAAER